MSERDMELTLKVIFALALRALFLWLAMLTWNDILATKLGMPSFDFLEAMAMAFVIQSLTGGGQLYVDRKHREMLK